MSRATLVPVEFSEAIAITAINPKTGPAWTMHRANCSLTGISRRPGVGFLTGAAGPGWQPNTAQRPA